MHNLELEEKKDEFQSTPSAWRETCVYKPLPDLARHFNPLPPHGGRPTLDSFSNHLSEFQSTPSAWRETECMRNAGNINFHFNPLPPHGGRLHCFLWSPSIIRFQSTPSAWRETTGNDDSVKFLNISIHSLRMEGDDACQFWKWAHSISIHSLRMEGDLVPHPSIFCRCHFNPLPPHGGRRRRRCKIDCES